MSTTRTTTPAARLSAEHVRRAMSLARQGRVYDLDCERFPGMPLFPGHPPFQVMSYRTPVAWTTKPIRTGSPTTP